MDDLDMVDVIVVGAGPAGLVAATTLAAHGITVVLIEKRTREPELPRATVASTRTMELMRSFGLAGLVRKGADEVEMTLLETRTAREAASGVVWDVGFPSLEQAAVLSPEAPACVAQDHLEGVLLQALHSRETVRVVRGLTVHGVAQADEAVRVDVTDAAGVPRTLRASWVIAADGAWSAVRHSLGIAVRGRGDAMLATQLEVRAPLWEVVGAHRHLLYAITHPEAPGVLLPAGRGDRWVFAREFDAATSPPDLADAVRDVQVASGVADLPVTALRHRRVTIGAQIATTFSADRCFLVGDAAHRVTPRGGTGLNTAIAGAHDLAWKLAWVIRGWASRAFLDTYEAERRVVAEHNLTRSLDRGGARRGADEEAAVDLAGRVRHLWLDDARRRSTLDALSLGLTLLAGPRLRRGPGPDAPPRLKGRRQPPVTVVQLTAIQARVLGLSPDQALLVRPDGVPVPAAPQAMAS